MKKLFFSGFIFFLTSAVYAQETSIAGMADTKQDIIQTQLLGQLTLLKSQITQS